MRLKTMRKSWRRNCVTVDPPWGVAFILPSYNHKIHDTHTHVETVLYMSAIATAKGLSQAPILQSFKKYFRG